MPDGPPTPPSPGDDDFREKVKESEEFQNLQDSLDSLGEMVAKFEEERAYKEAATLGMVPEEERRYADELVGSLLITSLGEISLAAGYYATARQDSTGQRGGEDGWYSTVAVVVITVGPREDTNFGRGHVSGHFISKYDMAFGPLNTVPGTGAPDPDDYETFKLKETGGWNVDERVEAYRDLLHEGVFDHLIERDGYDSRDALYDALGVGKREHPSEGFEYEAVDVFPPGYSPPDIVAADEPEL